MIIASGCIDCVLYESECNGNRVNRLKCWILCKLGIHRKNYLTKTIWVCCLCEKTNWRTDEE
jgi:hypothetical protein